MKLLVFEGGGYEISVALRGSGGMSRMVVNMAQQLFPTWFVQSIMPCRNEGGKYIRELPPG